MAKNDGDRYRGRPEKPFDPVYDGLLPDEVVKHHNRHPKSGPKSDGGHTEMTERTEWGDSMPSQVDYRTISPKELEHEPEPDDLING